MLLPQRAAGDLPFVTGGGEEVGEGGGLAGTVTTFLQIAGPPGSIYATSSMKGPPWAGTMSGITPLIVTPGLELLSPQTPVPLN